MATHSNILAWRIPWTEEPGRLQSMGLQRVGHDWATSLSFFFQSAVGPHVTVPSSLVPGLPPGHMPTFLSHTI